jgi:hypothetical protein
LILLIHTQYKNILLEKKLLITMEMKDVVNVDHNYKSIDGYESVNSVDSVDCKMEDCRSGEDSESVDRNRKSKKTKDRRMNKNVALKKKRITKRIHKIIDEKVC